MKRACSEYVYALALTLAITGCGLAPAKFDETQQLGYAQIWQEAGKLKESCGGHPARSAEILATIQDYAELLGAYVEYQTDEASRQLVRALRALVAEVLPGGGATYCRESAANLQAAAVRAMQTTGRRPR